MDNSYLYATENAHEDVFMDHSLQDAAPPCFPSNPHRNTMDTAARPSLPADGDFSLPLGQNTADDALSSWQNAEVDFSGTFQQAFARPLVWPEVDPFMPPTGQGQVFNAGLGIPTMHQTDPFGFGTQEPSSWPLPAIFSADAASNSYLPDCPQSQYPMELVSSNDAGTLAVVATAQPISAPTVLPPRPPPLLPSRKIERRKKARKGQACWSCRRRHRRCNGGQTCLQGIAELFDPGVRNRISSKFEILDIVEAGSYFLIWGITPSCEIFSGYEWQAFYEAFSTLKLVKERYDIKLTSELSSNTCTIPFDMVHSCFAAMPDQGGGPSMSTTSKALAIIKDIVRLHPLGQHIALDLSDSGTKPHIWASAISFCQRGTSEWLLTDRSLGSANDGIKKSTLELFKSTRSRLKEAHEEESTPLYAYEITAVESGLSVTLQEIEDEQEATDLQNLADEYLRALREPATNNVTFQLSWIVSRYLELCMFGYIQNFFNSGAKRTQTEIKEFITILCSIVVVVERPSLMSAQLDTPPLSGTMKVLVDDLIDRQDRIRTALWVCCSIMLSKLDPFNNHVVACFFKTLRPRSGNGHRQLPWASVESLDQDTMTSLDDIKLIVQHSRIERSAVTETLTMIKEAIVAHESIGSENAFQCLFKDVATGFLDDLELESLGTSLQLNQLKAGRLFLALRNLSWDLSSIPGLGGVFEEVDDKIPIFALNLLQKMQARRNLVFIYRNTLEKNANSQVKRSLFEFDLDSVDLTHHYDSTAAPQSRPLAKVLAKGCCIGRRWHKLMEVTGEAIILCGSPLIDHSSNWNIPKIVETGSNEEFDSLRAALHADMRWVIEVCRELKHVPAMLDDFSELLRHVSNGDHNVSRDDVQHAIVNITEHIPSAVGIVSPASLLSGELRSIGLGTSSQDILHELDAIGYSSSLGYMQLFGVCLDGMRKQALPRSKAELADLKAKILSLLSDAPSEVANLIEPCLRLILDNLWF